MNEKILVVDDEKEIAVRFYFACVFSPRLCLFAPKVGRRAVIHTTTALF